MKRQWTALLLAGCIGMGAMPIYGATTTAVVEEQTKPNYTVTQAVNGAVKNSRQLELYKKQYELKELEIETMLNMQYYKGLKNAILEKKYAASYEKIMEESIRYQTEQYFLSTIELEMVYKLQEKSVAVNQKELRQAEILHDRGMLSALQLQSYQLAYEREVKSVDSLKGQIEENYVMLEQLVGKSLKGYDLVAPNYELVPYEVATSLEAMIATIINNDLNIWRAQEQILIAEIIDERTYDTYGDYASYQYNIEVARVNEAALKENMTATVTRLYNAIRAAERDYAVLNQELSVRERQLAMTKLQYEKGIASLLDYEKAQLAYDNTAYQLASAKDQHYLAVYRIKKPYLL